MLRFAAGAFTLNRLTAASYAINLPHGINLAGQLWVAGW